MNNTVLDAAYMTAHDYPGGATALAIRMGVNHTVLSNKLNPNNKDHNLYLQDALPIMVMTNDHRILHALCKELGLMVIPLPTIGEETTVEAITDTCRDFADYLHGVTTSLADGVITNLELRTTQTELAKLIAQAGKLESILAGMEARHSKPPRRSA
jgi:hypothetical protein